MVQLTREGAIVYIHTYICMYLCIYIYVYIYICIYIYIVPLRREGATLATSSSPWLTKKDTSRLFNPPFKMPYACGGGRSSQGGGVRRPTVFSESRSSRPCMCCRCCSVWGCSVRCCMAWRSSECCCNVFSESRSSRQCRCCSVGVSPPSFPGGFSFFPLFLLSEGHPVM